MAVRISLNDITDAMDMQSQTLSSYLNVLTGELVTVLEEDLEAADGRDYADECDDVTLETARAVLEGNNYVPLPDHFEIDEYRMMERFAAAVPNEKSSDLLLVTLQGPGAFRRFKDTLTILDLLDEWYRFRDEAYKEIAIDWCEQNNIEYERP